MCTVTWLRNSDGYDLLFNRDELNSRKPAQPPIMSIKSGTEFISPIDGDHGGTWIGINQFGLSLCLLNGYEVEATKQKSSHVSRGFIIPDLMNCSLTREVAQRLSGLNLRLFRPFKLLAIDLKGQTGICEWDGDRFCDTGNTESLMLLSSSSFESERVIAGRREAFQSSTNAKDPELESLFFFHRSHLPTRSAYSVCMHRPDAATVSFSWISVKHELANFHYLPQSPCQLGLQLSRHWQSEHGLSIAIEPRFANDGMAA